MIPFSSLSLSYLLDERLIDPNNSGKFDLYEIKMFNEYLNPIDDDNHLQFQIIQQIQLEEL